MLEVRLKDKTVLFQLHHLLILQPLSSDMRAAVSSPLWPLVDTQGWRSAEALVDVKADLPLSSSLTLICFPTIFLSWPSS